MNNTKVILIIVLIAVGIGALYFYWNKSVKPKETYIDDNKVVQEEDTYADYTNTNLIEPVKHFNLNTVGGSMRNASHDLRYTPPIPKNDNILPWGKSTLEPELDRKGICI